MSLFRSLLAAVAIAAVAFPAFADDTTIAPAAGVSDTAVQQSANTKIDLNKATVKELTNVKGINARRARAIVSYRKKHGDFKSIDELSAVKGFKKMNPEQLKDITDQISVE